jgi:sulfur carrier protein ThiS
MSMETAISIVVNGEKREAKPGAMVADLLVTLGLDSGRVAIERNTSAPRMDRNACATGRPLRDRTIRRRGIEPNGYFFFSFPKYLCHGFP